MENNPTNNKSTTAGERTSKIVESDNYELDSFSNAAELLYDINIALTPRNMRQRDKKESQSE
jgi:hypothetical protein